MNAATILLVLAAAGQTAWAPDRYGSPPPAAAPATTAPNYDRYAMPPSNNSRPSSTRSAVAPPPGVAERTRTAVSETGTTLRDGFEAGVNAANEQLSRSGGEIQGWTDDARHQFQSAGDNLRVAAGQALGVQSNGSSTNPIGASSAPPATPKARSGVAPPPWSGSSATAEPDWTNESFESNTPPNRSSSPGLAPVRSETGWTSIRSDVAAPRLLIPQLITSSTNDATIRRASNDGRPSFPTNFSAREPSRPAESPAPPNDWSTGWETGSQQATIGHDEIHTSAGNTHRGAELPPLQPANRRLQDARQQDARLADTRQADSQPAPQATNNWVDLWSENDPFPASTQTPPASSANQPANQTAAAPIANHGGNQPIVAPALNATSSASGAPVVLPPAANTQPGRNPSAPASATEQPPWMPLLVVSLSLAGSLGANLFLGFSYLDARQKYRSLIHKTAGRLRRSVAAA